MSLLQSASRSAAFLLGHLRTQPTVPWFSSSVRKPLISTEEAIDALSVARFGDVGLHRDTNYLSNLIIPGAMKHAWLHTHDVEDTTGRNKGYIVDATSVGVCSSHALTQFISDYAILLRPRGVTDKQRKGACLKAGNIVGASYDITFNFDIEHELKFYKAEDEEDKQEAVDSLLLSAESLKKYNYAFSCSEVVAYSWWHCRKELQISRRKWLGKDVILPIDFMHSGFEIVWCSESWTVDIARQQGLGEQALDMLVDWKYKG